MQPELLPFALQHVVTGVILYTLYAIQPEIDAANKNLQGTSTLYRYVQVDGQPKLLPQPKS